MELKQMDCYGADRDALKDFELYFKNSNLSDVTLIVSGEPFPAHKLILVKSSKVFECMLSQNWSGEKKEIELVEEALCADVFPAFLRFLYCNHIVLSSENAMPVLMLADKYNVSHLQKVCIDYAAAHILPELSLKNVFHVWFQYGMKCFHQALVAHCLSILAKGFQIMISQADWKDEWLSLDREQLIEFLEHRPVRGQRIRAVASRSALAAGT